MKTCKEVKNKLTEYYYNEINEDEKEGINTHLKSCANCLEEYESLKKLLNTASNIKPPKLNERFWNTFYYEIKEKINRRMLNSYKIWRIPVIVSACILIIMIAVNNYKNNLQELDAIDILTTSAEIIENELLELDFEIIAETIEIPEDLLLAG